MGSDAAIEAADVVLMDDDPLQIAKAIRISRKCIGIVRQNIVFSLIVKICLPCPDGRRYHEHVGRHLRRRRRDDPRRAQRHPRPARPQSLS